MDRHVGTTYLLTAQGGYHFQLAGVQTPEGMQHLFDPDKIPSALLQIYQTDARHSLVSET